MHDLYEGVAASTATIGMKEVEEEKKDFIKFGVV